MAALSLTTGAKFKLNTAKQQTVGGTAAALTAPVSGDSMFGKQPQQIFVQAAAANTGKITIGLSSGVTAGGAGIELTAGANTILPSHNPSDWYVIATASGQLLNIIYSGQEV